jgi:hypothetical protein
MDAFLAISSLINNPVSRFEDVKPTGGVVIDVKGAVKTAEIVGYTVLAVTILIGLFAAYLSWTCYENVTYYSIPARILFAIFAYMFGLLYLIIYALFNSSSCSSRARHHRSSRR